MIRWYLERFHSVFLGVSVENAWLNSYCYCSYLPSWDHLRWIHLLCQLAAFPKGYFSQCFYGKFFIENFIMITYLSFMCMTIFQEHLWQNNLSVYSQSFNSFDASIPIVKTLVNWLALFINMIRTLTLTHISPVLYSLSKPVICVAWQIKWLVSLWNATLGWKGLYRLSFHANLIMVNVKLREGFPNATSVIKEKRNFKNVSTKIMKQL